jgi:hypothetical protein
VCPACYAVARAGVAACKCGFVFRVVAREVEAREGELVEVTKVVAPEVLARRREQGRAGTVEQLTEVGRARGMKNPEGWARHVVQARMAKRRGAG